MQAGILIYDNHGTLRSIHDRVKEDDMIYDIF